GEKALQLIAISQPDLILLDIQLLGIDGLEVCQRLKSSTLTSSIPVILISGHSDFEKRIAGLNLGAADYINKPFQMEELRIRIKLQLSLRNNSLLLTQQAESLRDANQKLQQEIERRQSAESELCKIIDRSERSRLALLSVLEDQKIVEAKKHSLLNVVQQEKCRLEALINSITDEVWFTDCNGMFTLANPVAKKEFNLRNDKIDTLSFAKSLEVLWPDGTPRPAEEAPVLRAIKGEIVRNFEEIVRTPATGELRYRVVNSNPVRDETGQIIGAVSVVRDITVARQNEEKQRQLEGQVRQSQKLEAIGQLSSGVAHDFNNLLGGIMGNTELLLMEAAPGSSQIHNLESIVASCKRASTLTRQLLTFARKAPAEIRPIAVNEVIRQVVSIFCRTIDRRIEIVTEFSGIPLFLEGDQSLLENALLNLAINARDAMPDGGKVIFSTKSISLTTACVTESIEIPVGMYVKISVEDTGEGIPKEVQTHIFEPFFTTKELGKGTGLGLASVYGCIKQHNGYITVNSVVGKGTRFDIYLPLINPPENDLELEVAELVHGQGTILVIDDENVYHSILKEMFEMLGYEVVCYYDGITALEYYKEHYSTIDIIILDINMPKMNGIECYNQLKEINPDVQVIVASGYSDNGTNAMLQSEDVALFVQKPFKISELSIKVAALIAKTKLMKGVPFFES
ncbi:MAG TPA: response regulator, partial [Chitinispirillaceae bacterium]|nr:response regulator [Chitinispirillaceae bacterium]